MRIGELARQTRCRVETIRYYERAGLLPKPGRSGGNYRVYGREHGERLQFIRHCRSLDMTLDEVRALLGFRDAPTENCGAVNALLDEHIEHVASRIGELQELERQLKRLRKLCASVRSAKDCKILHELAGAAAPSPDDAHAGHVVGAHAHGSRSRKPGTAHRGQAGDASS